MHRCSPEKDQTQPPVRWPKIPPELEPPQSGQVHSMVAAIATLALFVGAAAGLSVATVVNLRVDLLVGVPIAGTEETQPRDNAERFPTAPSVPRESPPESLPDVAAAPEPSRPPSQQAIVRAVGGQGGIFLEAHCDADTVARDHDLLALTRDVPGKPEPTFVGLVDVVRVRDRRFVAVALGGKPALGDTLLVEAVDEFAAR